MVDELAIGEKFRAPAGELNERQRRLWAASEARAAGRGAIAATARATGISVPTIHKGIAELESGERLDPGRVRRPGGGRHALADVDPTLLKDLERLVSQSCRGDLESLLLWTSRSVRHLAQGLREHRNASAPSDASPPRPAPKRSSRRFAAARSSRSSTGVPRRC
jgi:hypothetical protein